MKSKFTFALTVLLLSTLAARSQDTSDMPPDVRWRENVARFFFANSGDTTEFWHSFQRATTLWQPGNFTMSLGSDASNNRPCFIRSPGVRIVNIAQFASSVCAGSSNSSNYGPGVLAVTFNQWNPLTKEMLAADMFFNTAYRFNIYNGPNNPSRPDFQRTAIHELGHAAGLNHSPDRASIMFPTIGDIERPNPNDQQLLGTKYATPISPGPPGEFACDPNDPYTPTVELGTLTQTMVRLGECLDGSRPNRIFNFQLASPRKIKLSLVADETEVNVEVLSPNGTGYWQSVNSGMKDKSKIVDFPAGQFWARVWFQTSGSHYRLIWEFQ